MFRLLLPWKCLPVAGCLCWLLACSTQAGPFTQAEIDYFLEVAMGAEYGSNQDRIKKWVQDVRVQVFGTPTAEDRKALDGLIVELNELAAPLRLSLVTEKPNVEIHFAPESEFKSIETNYKGPNDGFFWTWWNSRGEIYRARILIRSDKIRQVERSHLIREELTQSLGLMRDSERYPKSIFYTRWTSVTEYTPMDRQLIRMLYLPAIRPNMKREEVLRVLESP